MTRVLLQKLIRLGKGEDGAALIVTLALFMFMYVSCAGIFAIGQTAKNRIHLQNACDAAAYSAAVVQADTLSRIATINRAMAWTYISMTKRQMDYIVWKWLDETVKLVAQDVITAKSLGSPGAHSHPYWSLRPAMPIAPLCYSWENEDDDDVRISLNTSYNYPRVGPAYVDGTIKHEISYFESKWFNNSSGNAPSFYNGAGNSINILKKQIAADKETLNEMYTREKKLAEDLPGRVKVAVENILLANAIKGADLMYKVIQSATPYGAGNPSDSYLQILDKSKEIQFLGFADYSPADVRKPFDKGSGSSEWFPLSEGTGFCRKYKQRSDALYSSWTWRSWKWICSNYGCAPMDAAVKSQVYQAINCHDSYFDGVAAMPLVLKESYFGEKGTITVGLACYNENPWYRIFKNSAGVGKGILGGIFAAFNPYEHVEWSWAFSSAKAGYKFKNESIDTRDYMVDWNGSQSWNLCQPDWDAVFVPVRRAMSKANDKEWVDDKFPPLDNWVRGGDWQPLFSSGTIYAVSSMPDLPGMHRSGGSSGEIKWDDVARMLYH